MIIMRTFKAIIMAACLSALVSLILVFVLGIPLSRLDVPYTFNGDAVDKLVQIKTVSETGWLFNNPRLGFPYGYDRLDFPRFDSLNYAIMGAVSYMTTPGTAMNLYFIAGFYLIAFSGFFGFRLLGLSAPVAVICSLVFAFIPYHIIRGVSHLTNGTYYLIPLGVLVAVRLAQGTINVHSSSGRRELLLSIFVAILLPLQTPYNGVFFVFLCGVSAIILLTNTRNWRYLVAPALIIGVVVTTFMAEQIPRWIHVAEHGSVSVPRTPQDAEIYAMRINQIIVPAHNHRIDVAREFSKSFNETMEVPNTEVRGQYVGAIGVIGIFVLFWSFFIERNKDNDDFRDLGTLRILAIMTFAMFALAIVSGVGNFIAYFITDKIRAYNRILPFVAFCCIFSGGWALQKIISLLPSFSRNAAILILGTCVVLEATPLGWTKESRNASIADYDTAKEYFKGIEDRFGLGARLFQLPVVWYPEAGPRNRMIDYDHFKPYLLTDTLVVSYGNGMSRKGFAWSHGVAKMPPADMTTELASKDFDAILVDGFGYQPEALSLLIYQLEITLGKPVVSSDHRWFAFALDAASREVDEGWNLRVPLDVPLMFNTNSGVSVVGWHRPEPWGTWLPNDVSLTMKFLPDPVDDVLLTVETIGLVGPELPFRSLKIYCGDTYCGEQLYSLKTPNITLKIRFPKHEIKRGIGTIRFLATPASSPSQAGINTDDRPIGIGITQMQATVPINGEW